MEAELPWLGRALENYRELAPAQKIILGCLAAGMDIRTTAAHLCRSEHTVKSQPAEMTDKQLQQDIHDVGGRLLSALGAPYVNYLHRNGRSSLASA